jgi:hypothetical protein
METFYQLSKKIRKLKCLTNYYNNFYDNPYLNEEIKFK